MDFSDFGYLRVAAATSTTTIGDPRANAAAVIDMAQRLAAQGVAVAVFGELCLSGYSAEDLFFSDALHTAVEQALVGLTRDNPLPVLVVGTPWRLADGRLLNCGAVISGGRLHGLVPKSVHPNYGEFYDLRWFVAGGDVNERIVHPTLGAYDVRVDQLFDIGRARFAIEICEDLWAPEAPSTPAALAGADVILNLSASNELIAKADYRRNLIRMASAKNICGYVYASAGPTESTKDVVYGGHCLIAENGLILSESERFSLDDACTINDLDIAHLRNDRGQNTTFAGSNRHTPYRIIELEAALPALPQLTRSYPKRPFVPDDEHEFDARAVDILSIQATGLARRMLAARTQRLVIGLSGGLDSTLAFLVCLDALNKLHLDVDKLVAITMPGPGTSSLTRNNAARLCDATGVSLTTIDIHDAVQQHLDDLGHDGGHDVVFENAQARERTQILFNYANKVGGIVVGTGDLSELALGWCTFNADQMASYNVNASVPKTLVAYLVRWYAKHRADPAFASVLEEVLGTPISPELIPPGEGDAISQHTEDIVGPYELHDFFLYHYLRNRSAPEKIFYLARTAFEGEYAPETIRHWLGQFFRRFFSQQFKRTTLPPGPKIGSVSLSPRGDWRMPDEASAEPILAAIDQIDIDN